MERQSLDAGWERDRGGSSYRRRLEPSLGWMGMEISLEIERLGPGVRLFINGAGLELEAYGPSSYRALLSPRLRYDESNLLLLSFPGLDPASIAARARIWLRVEPPRSRAPRRPAEGFPRRRPSALRRFRLDSGHGGIAAPRSPGLGADTGRGRGMGDRAL